MTGTPGFVGARLRQAREARGLTALALADLISVKSANISNYEHGKQSPSPEVLVRISQVLNRPAPFFLRRPMRFSSEGVNFRSMSSATKAARTRILARFEWLKEIVSYLSEYVDFPTLNLPTFALSEDPTQLSMEQIDHLASECRGFWGLGEGPVADVVLLLENNGVIVSRGEIGAPTLDAFSQWPPDSDRPYVFLGSDKASAVRSRFDAAHELGHLLLHRRLDAKSHRNAATHNLLELQGHRFALSFLLPATGFTTDLWAPTLDGFLALKSQWKVSIQAMVKRCEQLDLLNEDQVKRCWLNISRRGWRKREPLDDELSIETPRLLRRSFEVILLEGLTTRSQILQALASPAKDVELLAGLSHGFLEADETMPGLALKQRIEPSRQPTSAASKVVSIRKPCDVDS